MKKIQSCSSEINERDKTGFTFKSLIVPLHIDFPLNNHALSPPLQYDGWTGVLIHDDGEHARIAFNMGYRYSRLNDSMFLG